MSYLLRVELPDVPGSLGKVASAIGLAGGNIGAIEIVEHTSDGTAIDDVFLTPTSSTMPDTIVSACNSLDGVQVLWISRYAAGGQLFLDLEIVEEMTHKPDQALQILVDSLPSAFRVDWAAQLHDHGDRVEIVRGTSAAPEEVPEGIELPDDLVVGRRVTLPEPYQETLVALVPVGTDILVIARRGGPEILDSEIARVGHLAALAVSVKRAARTAH